MDQEKELVKAVEALSEQDMKEIASGKLTPKAKEILKYVGVAGAGAAGALGATAAVLAAVGAIKAGDIRGAAAPFDALRDSLVDPTTYTHSIHPWKDNNE